MTGGHNNIIPVIWGIPYPKHCLCFTIVPLPIKNEIMFYQENLTEFTYSARVFPPVKSRETHPHSYTVITINPTANLQYPAMW